MDSTKNDKRWKVYVHKNKKNGKCYVGITSLPIERRWSNGYGYRGQFFFKAIEKYGWDGFEHIIIAEDLTRDEARKLEIKTIKDLGSLINENGYNVDSGDPSEFPHSGIVPNLIGKQFGRLTVIAKCKPQNGHTLWRCKCECGNETLVQTACLTRKTTTSCGCHKRELVVQRSTTHGDTHARIYKLWYDLKWRINKNQSNPGLHFKKADIKMCEEWKDYLTFKEWAFSHGYDDKKTLVRIDKNGDFSPDNCRWGTQKDAANTRESCVFIEFNGENKTIRQWSEQTGIQYATLKRRYDHGVRGEALFATDGLRLIKKGA